MAKRPNILLFLVDELRYPTVYDSAELRAWMAKNLKAQAALRANGVDFPRHYVQSAACAPSRTSIFTGQYPSLHGVAQTDGIGKTTYDPITATATNRGSSSTRSSIRTTSSSSA